MEGRGGGGCDGFVFLCIDEAATPNRGERMVIFVFFRVPAGIVCPPAHPFDVSSLCGTRTCCPVSVSHECVPCPTLNEGAKTKKQIGFRCTHENDVFCVFRSVFSL